MKLKLLLLSLIVISSYLNVIAQKVVRPLNEIIIFKIVNQQNDVKQQLVRIDANGKVYANQKLVDSFDIQKLTKAVNEYVMKEKIEKDEANNNPPPPALEPKLNEQAIHILVWFRDDVEKEKEFMNKTNYLWVNLQDKTASNYPLYKYLSPKEVSALKQFLQ